MDRIDAGVLTERVTKNGTLATAKEYLQIMQPFLTGEKVTALPNSKKLLLTVACAIEYGRATRPGGRE